MLMKRNTSSTGGA